MAAKRLNEYWSLASWRLRWSERGLRACVVRNVTGSSPSLPHNHTVGYNTYKKFPNNSLNKEGLCYLLTSDLSDSC